MNELKNLVDKYEREEFEFASFCRSYKDRPVEQLESIALDFQLIYAFGDGEGNPEDLIPEQDRMVFHHWEPSTQTNFIAYLTAKIALLRNAIAS